MLANTKQRWNRIMAVEMGYGIKQRGIHFELLLLFPDTSMERIYSRLVDIED